MSADPNLDSLISYYQSLLLFQYKAQPNAAATIAILAKKAMLDDLPYFLNQAFNLNTAVGYQLDILGKYIGVSRQIGPPAAVNYFGFVDYISGNLQNYNGFSDYTNPINNATLWFSYLYVGTQNTALIDSAYAQVMKLQIILNAMDGTLNSIQNYLNQFFKGLVFVTDNQNMSLTYTVWSTCPIPAATLLFFLPRPMGVSISVVYFNPAHPGATRVTSDGSTRVTSDGSTRTN